MKAELFTVEVLDVAFICQDVICSRTNTQSTHQVLAWIQDMDYCPKETISVYPSTNSVQWGMNTVLLLCVMGDWICALMAEIGVCFWLCTGSAGSCAVQGCTIPNKRNCLSCVPRSLATAHVLTFLLLPSWTITVTRSHRLPLPLYEWWPFPALDRKEDRSHLNSAVPPLLNQTPQCQYKCIHTHTHCIPLSITLTQEGHSNIARLATSSKNWLSRQKSFHLVETIYCSEHILWSLT